MSLNLGGWIHSFTVTDTQKHKGGYTIYKITSIVFPRSLPQALTCLVVWKRYHDVRRLHRELSRRHKSLQLPGKLPAPTDGSYFRRFDAEVIDRRKECILHLLDFAAQHPALYKCNAFAQFFSDCQSSSNSPLHKLYTETHSSLQTNDKNSHANKFSCLTDKESQEQRLHHSGEGAIAEICDKLDLPYDAHNAGGIAILDPTRDIVSEVNNNGGDCVAVEESVSAGTCDVDANASSKCAADTSRKYAFRFLTPMASVESDDSDYIYEAALEFSHAVQAEVNLEYKTAHERYQCGINLLLSGSKDDANDERKFIAKAKISKYLARAEEIHSLFLRESANKLNFQLSIDVVDNAGDAVYLERPWNQLAKYKVIRILGERVMQVQCITEPQQASCIMKGIEKPSSNSSAQSIFLPQQVPYMVELLAFFQSDHKVFLLLKQAEGGLLYDYIQSYTPTAVKCTNYAQLFPTVGSSDTEDVNSKDSGFLDTEALPKYSDFTELVRNSQQLLQSVSKTLHEVKEPTEPSQSPVITAASSSKMSAPTVKIPETCLRQWACELAVAIHSLHEKSIILSDLHMSNLLLGNKGQLLLSYFYQNEGINSDDSYAHKSFNDDALYGHFVAAERPLSFKSDWWSYGIILYQLLLGLSFKCAHPGQIDLYHCVQYPENVEISDHAQDLLDNLLQPMPEARFDYEQIQTHAFFYGIDWQQVLKNGQKTTTHSSSNPCLKTTHN